MSSQDNNQVYSKGGDPIQEGDHVYTKIRGGRHEGDVETIVTTKDAAKEYGVKHPPKVLFTDQKGKEVQHNPETLDMVDK